MNAEITTQPITADLHSVKVDGKYLNLITLSRKGWTWDGTRNAYATPMLAAQALADHKATEAPVVPDTSKVYGVKTQTLTYLGSRARVTTTKHQTRATGLRTVEYVWLDDAHPDNGGHPAGTRVVKVIQGDGRPGRKPTFILHSTTVTPPN